MELAMKRNHQTATTLSPGLWTRATPFLRRCAGNDYEFSPMVGTQVTRWTPRWVGGGAGWESDIHLLHYQHLDYGSSWEVVRQLEAGLASSSSPASLPKELLQAKVAGLCLSLVDCGGQ